VTMPDHLAGRCNINYAMSSGYIPVTSVDFLFYWHFGPKQTTPGAVTPVIFWTNGGPGCSAMEGALNELGPLSLFKAKDGSALYTAALSDNPYSWNT
jgi:cathepsin A (carboxypeptidase C)